MYNHVIIANSLHVHTQDSYGFHYSRCMDVVSDKSYPEASMNQLSVVHISRGAKPKSQSIGYPIHLKPTAPSDVLKNT